MDRVALQINHHNFVVAGSTEKSEATDHWADIQNKALVVLYLLYKVVFATICVKVEQLLSLVDTARHQHISLGVSGKRSHTAFMD